MPGVPSNRACDQCKKRHVKCDEGRPSCQKCITAGVECPGYSQDRKFIDEGASVRRRYAPYRRGAKSGKPTETNETPAVSDEDTSHTNVASTLTPQPGYIGGSSVSDNLNNPSTGLSLVQTSAGDMNIGSHGLVGSGASISQPQSMLQSPVVSGSASMGVPYLGYEPNLSLSWETGLDSNMNLQYPGVVPSVSQSEGELDSFLSELMINSEREIAFLVRHYTDSLGHWLDLHDSENYFTLVAPRRALHVPFIQHAISAVSAKHINRTGGISSLNTKSAISQTYPNMTQVDWSFKASNYYFQSLSYIIQLVTGNADFQQTDVTEPPIRILYQCLSLDPGKMVTGQPDIPATAMANLEDILCGTTILTLYDILDTAGPEWESRLYGLNSLLECLMLSPTLQPQLRTSHAMHAAFWNFVFFDYLASYANRRRTTIDPSNLDLFRSAGLQIDGEGKLELRNFGNARCSQVDETFSHGLLYLLLQLMNFIAEFKEMQQATMQSTTPPDISLDAPAPQSSRLTATWHRLSQEVKKWRDALPDSFSPYISLHEPRELPSSTPSIYPELVFSAASHGATIAHYNFARIVLLLNRPHDAHSTPRDRLLGYREVTKEVDGCIREIGGIAKANPPAAVQAFMLQPLFVVGQCDDRPEARRKINELIRAIRTEMGWEVDYRLKQLHAVWDRT